MHLRTFALAVLVGMVLCLSLAAQSAAPATTTLTVEEMHCAGCAKKVATKLVTVDGVAKVEVTLQTKSFVITPKPKATLSPKALWEVAEKAEAKPTKLEGPSGSFTSKPKV